MTEHKEYLGDGAYVDHDGYNIILTTENGIETTNTVYLEPIAWKRLAAWVERMSKAAKP